MTNKYINVKTYLETKLCELWHIQECLQVDRQMDEQTDRRTIILVWDIWSWANKYFYKIAWRYPELLLNYGAYKNIWKN